MNAQEKERHEEARELAVPRTPRSLMPRASYGSLLMQVPDRGCPSRKCIRPRGHDGECYPKGD